MLNEDEWRRAVGSRLKELRALKDWSLEELARKTNDRLKKSRLGNFEQGTRGVGFYEAMVLAEALGESPSHILCLDNEDMPALSKREAQLIHDMRALPEDQRTKWLNSIALMAAAYKATPQTDAAVERTAYNPKNRPASATPKKRLPGKHDN